MALGLMWWRAIVVKNLLFFLCEIGDYTIGCKENGDGRVRDLMKYIWFRITTVEA